MRALLVTRTAPVAPARGRRTASNLVLQVDLLSYAHVDSLALGVTSNGELRDSDSLRVGIRQLARS